MAHKTQKQLFFLIGMLFLVLPLFSAENWTSDLNRGLMAYYPLNETEGGIAYDSLGIKPFTINQGEWVSGKIDNGFYSIYTTADGDVYTGTTNDFSINMWIKRIGDEQRSGMISLPVNLEDRDADCVLANQFTIGYNDFNGIDICVCDAVGNQTTSNFFVEPDIWYMFSMVVNQSKMLIYINGVLNSSIDLTNFTLTTDNKLLLLMSEYGQYMPTINTTYDEIGVWNRTLTADEINIQLYNSGNGNTYKYFEPDEIPEEPQQTITFTEQGQVIYSVMSSSGAGLGIFINFMSVTLPPLLIILGLIGVIILICYFLSSIIKQNITKFHTN